MLVGDQTDLYGKRRKLIEPIWRAALAAVEPQAAVLRAVQRRGNVLQVAGRRYDLAAYRHVYLIGMGKAGAPMAQAAESLLGDRLTDGVVVVKRGHEVALQRCRLYSAGHPIPDEAGVAATREAVALAQKAGPDALLLVLISGGGSALFTVPALGLTLADLQQVTDLLLRAGATIQEMNAVRKHLSAVKGGHLAKLASPATVVGLVLSDVVGNSLDSIASGPLTPDSTTFVDVDEILQRYGLWERLPQRVRGHLRAGLAGSVAETPKVGDAVFDRVQMVVVADNRVAAQTAAQAARKAGFHTLLLSSFVEGEAREVAKVLSALAREEIRYGQPLPLPACFIAGGETTVTLHGGGKGGRNQELALAGAIALAGWPNVLLVTLATDGNDGPTDAAGGVVDGETVRRGAALGLCARDYLSRNDAYRYLQSTGTLLRTGPTNTNVNDLSFVFAFLGE